MSKRTSDILALHPKFQGVVRDLSEALFLDYETGRTKTLFKVFETFRTPERQAHLLTEGTTKAGPFESSHAFGLGVDIVPFVDGVWRWDVPLVEWEYMRKKANSFGLLTPYKWDLAHIDHPDWPKLQRALREIHTV